MGWRSMVVSTPFRCGSWRSSPVRGQGERGLVVGVGLVEAGGEDGLHGLVAERADVQRAAAGGFQAFGGIGARKPHEAEAAAVALFRMRPALEELLREGGGTGTDLSRPADEAGRGPFEVGAVRSGHVARVGRVSTLPASADVGRDAPVLVEDLDRRGAEPDIHLPPGKRVGNAVEAAVGLDVVVDVDAGLAPLGELVTLGRKRLQRRTVKILEETAAAALGLLERPLVERCQKRRDRLADLGEQGAPRFRSGPPARGTSG